MIMMVNMFMNMLPSSRCCCSSLGKFLFQPAHNLGHRSRLVLFPRCVFQLMLFTPLSRNRRLDVLDVIPQIIRLSKDIIFVYNLLRDLGNVSGRVLLENLLGLDLRDVALGRTDWCVPRGAGLSPGLPGVRPRLAGNFGGEGCEGWMQRFPIWFVIGG